MAEVVLWYQEPPVLWWGGVRPARCAWTELRAAEMHEAWVLSKWGAQSRCGVGDSSRKACLWVDVRLVVGAGIQGPARWAGAQVAVHLGTLRAKQWGEHSTFRTCCPVPAEMSPLLALVSSLPLDGVGLGGLTCRLSSGPSVRLRARWALGSVGAGATVPCRLLPAPHSDLGLCLLCQDSL